MRQPRCVRGTSAVEALVGAALVAIALAGLAATAAQAARSARLVRDTGGALAMAGERLEALRAGPRSPGADNQLAPGGTLFFRRWRVEGGRGNPTAIDARVAWDGGAIELATEALP